MRFFPSTSRAAIVCSLVLQGCAGSLDHPERFLLDAGVDGGIELPSDGALSYRETAGLRQLYRRRQLAPHEILAEAFATGGRR